MSITPSIFDVVNTAIEEIRNAKYKPNYAILSIRMSKYKNYRMAKRLKAII